MVRVVIGKSVQDVPERVARILALMASQAMRIEAVHTGSIAINWSGESVQAKLSESIEVPRSPA